MPYYINNFRTLRVAAGLTQAAVAKMADLSPDTNGNIEKHKSCGEVTLVAAIHALNKLHYSANGGALDPDKLIIRKSSYGNS